MSFVSGAGVVIGTGVVGPVHWQLPVSKSRSSRALYAVGKFVHCSNRFEISCDLFFRPSNNRLSYWGLRFLSREIATLKSILNQRGCIFYTLNSWKQQPSFKVLLEADVNLFLTIQILRDPFTLLLFSHLTLAIKEILKHLNLHAQVEQVVDTVQ